MGLSARKGRADNDQNENGPFDIGIRGQLMLIFVTIIMISGVVIGASSYYNARNLAFDQIRENLENRSEDWNRIVDSYQAEVNRTILLEEDLVSEELNTTSFVALEWMRSADDSSGGIAPSSIREHTYRRIANIDVHSDGYIFVIVGSGENRGELLVSEDHTMDGENILLETDRSGNFIVMDMIETARKTPGIPEILRYSIRDRVDGTYDDMIGSLVYHQPWDAVIVTTTSICDFRSDVESELKEMAKNRIGEQVIGKTGYIWVLRGKGEDRGEYIVSGKRERDGENLWDMKDSDGNYFVREMVKEGMRSPDDAFFYSYHWKNPGESDERKKIAAITYMEEWDWVIGASAYESEFLDDVHIMRDRIIVFTLIELLIAVVATLLIGTKYAKTITRPLKKLSRRADEIGKGRLGPSDIERSAIGGSKEIKKLARNLEEARIANIQREKANDMLERSESRLRKLTEMLPEIVFETDGRTELTFQNDIGYKKLGRRKNQKLVDMILPRQRKRFLKELRELVKGRESVPREFTVIKKDGSMFPALINMAIIRKNGKAVGYRGIIIDISNRKENERRIREEKNKAEFYLDMLGHDIGNLHMGLSSSLEMASMLRDDPDAQQRSLDLANSVARRSMKLTESVMLLSRIRSERPLLERIDIKKAIEEGASLARETYPEKNIHVQINGPTRRINAEPILKEAFYNIISNGIKVQTIKDPWIEINIRDSEERESVIVEISDKGYGIPDSEKRRIFERFWTSGKESRIGLGLSIVKALVDRYHGTLTVTDRIEGDHTKGTKFVLEFPRI